MAQWLVRVLILIAISFGLSYVPFNGYTEIISGYYTVIGIMFPLALTQIMSLSLVNVKNDVFVDRQRTQLNYIRKIFIILFSISTGLFFIKNFEFIFHWKWIKFNIQILFSIFFIFCIVYFIINFAQLATLKDEIDNEIRKVKNKQNE